MINPDLTDLKDVQSLSYCLQKIQEHQKNDFSSNITILSSGNNNTNVEWSLVQDGDHLLLIIPGSNDLTDWWYNAQRWLTPITQIFRRRGILPALLDYPQQGRKQPHPNETNSSNWSDEWIHAGFFQMYEAIKINIRQGVEKQCAAYDLPLVIIGHSLGAGMATLAALDISYNDYRKSIYVYLYGSPKVGNSAFANSYAERLKDTTIRVVNGCDIATILPTIGYQHVVENYRIGCQWKPPNTWDHHIKNYLRSLKSM
jgi:hypothetical protein